MRPTLALLALLSPALCLTGPLAADRPEGAPFATRSVVRAPHGLVAAAHPLAVQIGIDVLQDGGSAVDAAIAVNAALGLMEPVSCGIGGDLFALVWDAESGSLHGLNASGRSPAALRPEMVPPRENGTMPLYSPYAWTVPGAADGWFSLHERFGRLPMKRLLEPSIRYAEEGFPVSQMIAGSWARSARVFGEKPGFAEVFLPGGRAPREGEIFRNPALARSYRLMAEGGRKAYYEGEIAREMVDFSREHGGFFSLADLAGHHSDWVEPLGTEYRGVTLWELPPNGQGLAALQMLNILETFDLRAMGRDSADFWHLMVEAKKLAFADRARFYADPEFSEIPLEGLLSREYARRRAALIDMGRAARVVDPGNPALSEGDTTFLVAADSRGNMVSLIQSNYTGFGSGYVVPSLGFGIQNRGTLFTLEEGHPNRLEPGKRPFHTIIPAFLTREGRPWVAFGLMGGAMQPQGHAQIVVNLVDFEMNLQEAGDATRFNHSGSSQPTGTVMGDGGALHLESGIPVEVRRELVRRGHRLVDAVGIFGGYQAVALDPVGGAWAGATESRKDGCAQGY